MSLLNSRAVPRPSRVPAEAADVEGLPRKRTFVVLRFGFLIAASYLLLVTSDFGPLPAPFTVVIAAALA